MSTTKIEERRAIDARKDLREQRAHLDEARALAYGGQHESARPSSTVETGANAEALAVEHLLAHGYEIVERNYRCKLGELDIVAAEDDVMVFVEVRSRANTLHGGAIESVNRTKQRQVTRVAETYLQHRRPPHGEFRFDVVAIDGDAIELYRDAWRGGLL